MNFDKYCEREKELSFNSIVYKFNPEDKGKLIDEFVEISIKLNYTHVEAVIGNLEAGDSNYLLIIFHSLEDRNGSGFNVVTRGRFYSTNEGFIENGQ